MSVQGLCWELKRTSISQDPADRRAYHPKDYLPTIPAHQGAQDADNHFEGRLQVETLDLNPLGDCSAADRAVEY